MNQRFGGMYHFHFQEIKSAFIQTYTSYIYIYIERERERERDRLRLKGADILWARFRYAKAIKYCDVTAECRNSEADTEG
jgi:hypothetical protein